MSRVFTIKIPIDGGKFEKIRLEQLSVDDARRIVERLSGDNAEALYVDTGDDSEDGLSIMGGLNGKFVCEWLTPEGAGELLLQPGFDQISDNEEQAAESDCGWYPVEAIVDIETVTDVLVQYVKNGSQPSAFNWRLCGGM